MARASSTAKMVSGLEIEGNSAIKLESIEYKPLGNGLCGTVKVP